MSHKNAKWNNLNRDAFVAACLSLTVVAAQSTCYMWDDPQCYVGATVPKTCVSCDRLIGVPVTDHGTHWVVRLVPPPAWETYVIDTGCTYEASGNCPSCSALNEVHGTGPLDQLVSGGTCES
jgi:hypothetical protein